MNTILESHSESTTDNAVDTLVQQLAAIARPHLKFLEDSAELAADDLLADAGLDDMARDPYVVCDSEAMLAVLEEATPASAAGADTRYHYLTFGWLLEGIVRGVTGRTLADFVRNEKCEVYAVCGACPLVSGSNLAAEAKAHNDD